MLSVTAWIYEASYGTIRGRHTVGSLFCEETGSKPVVPQRHFVGGNSRLAFADFPSLSASHLLSFPPCLSNLPLSLCQHLIFLSAGVGMGRGGGGPRCPSVDSNVSSVSLQVARHVGPLLRATAAARTTRATARARAAPPSTSSPPPAPRASRKPAPPRAPSSVGPSAASRTLTPTCRRWTGR